MPCQFVTNLFCQILSLCNSSCINGVSESQRAVPMVFTSHRALKSRLWPNFSIIMPQSENAAMKFDNCENHGIIKIWHSHTDIVLYPPVPLMG